MSKAKVASEAQAKRIARSWAEGRPVRVMKLGRDNSDPYNDATTIALVKSGWIVPDGIEHVENGFVWEPHHLSDAALLALENFLMKRRLTA